MINCFEVEAKNEEEAEEIVRDYDLYKTCEDADYNINYVDELKDDPDSIVLPLVEQEFGTHKLVPIRTRSQGKEEN